MFMYFMDSIIFNVYFYRIQPFFNIGKVANAFRKINLLNMFFLFGLTHDHSIGIIQINILKFFLPKKRDYHYINIYMKYHIINF